MNILGGILTILALVFLLGCQTDQQPSAVFPIHLSENSPTSS